MLVRDAMTTNPVCCSTNSTVAVAARLMAETDCGEIPVLDHSSKVVGVITDRDVACRCVAVGRDPIATLVSDIMSRPVVTVTPETTLEALCATLEAHQIRRVPVVDATGTCCGIVAQADVARVAPLERTAEVVREISVSTQ